MKIEIEVNEKEAIKIGNEKFGPQIFDIDLTKLNDDERTFLAENAQKYHANSVDFYRINFDFYNYNTVREAGKTFKVLRDSSYPVQEKIELQEKPIFSRVDSDDEAVASLKLIIKFCKENKEKIKILEQKFDEVIESKKIKVFEELENYFLANIKEFTFENLKNKECISVASFFSLNHNYEVGQQLRTKYAEAIARCEKINEEVSEYKRDRAKEREIATFQVMKNFIETQGSERLKLMFELDENAVESAAAKEWAILKLPEGFEIGAGNGDTRKNPTLAELQALKEIRYLEKESPEIYLESQLEIIDEYDGKYAELQVKIQTPFNDNQTFWASKKFDL